jgi:hypothetical protein
MVMDIRVVITRTIERCFKRLTDTCGTYKIRNMKRIGVSFTESQLAALRRQALKDECAVGDVLRSMVDRAYGGRILHAYPLNAQQR